MPKIEYGEICPAAEALNVVAGKWKMPIIARLFREKKRFGDLKDSMDGISAKALAAALRELESDGIIERQVTHDMPVRIEYTLTDIGREMKPLLMEMNSWGKKYLTQHENKEKS